jgi:hypothetical protein
VFVGEESFEPSLLFVAKGFDVVVGFGAVTDGDEGGEEDFGEGIIDISFSGIVDLFDGEGEVFGGGFDFSLSVVFF